MGRGPHFDFGAVLKPHVHPLAYGVLLCPDGIHFGVFLDGPLELLLALLPGFCQHVFVDNLAGIRVTASRVAALPAAIAAFADVAFSVGSPFAIRYRLLSQFAADFDCFNRPEYSLQWL